MPVERLPRGRYVETVDEEQTLAAFREVMMQAQSMDLTGSSGKQFDTDRVMDDVISALDMSRLTRSIATVATV
jgi:hypothetical protein